CLQTYRSPFSF
nr:immunoglobulin light chain junction region [Macaca mulatta]